MRETRERVRERLDQLDARPWHHTLTQDLAETWDADLVGLYRPEATAAGWDLEILQCDGLVGPLATRVFRQYMQNAPPSFSWYNPLRPPPEQRNAVVDDEWLRRVGKEMHIVQHFYPAAGVADCSEVRTLVCDGPFLLARLGGFRKRAFGRADARLLKSLIPDLKRRLRIDRALAGSVAPEALETLLEAIGSPAMLVRKSGAVVHANALALQTLGDGIRGVLGRFGKRGFEGIWEREGDAFDVQSYGHGDLRVVVLRAPHGAWQPRVAEAARRWKLTPRQAQILSRLVLGEPNKDIAVRCGCASSTVEIHVTQILRKAKVESRSALIARFWTM